MNSLDPSRPTIRDAIQASLQSLSRAERQVALLLLGNYPAAGLSTVSSIAAEAHVSSPSVLRFVKTLGYGSFPEFKEALREEITAGSKGPLGRARERHGVSEPGVPLFRSQIARILDAADRCGDDLPVGEWDAMIDLLADATRPVYVTGGRFSIAVAHDLALNLQLIRPRVHLLDDVEYRDQALLLDMNRKSVFVVYDFLRFQRSVIRAARIAHQQGATIILFTDGDYSPIKSDAQIIIPVSTEGISPFSGLSIPMLYTEIALDVLYGRLAGAATDQLARWEVLRTDEIIN